MKNKWIFLFILLGLPALIFLFLNQFGESEFRLQNPAELQVYKMKSVNCEPNEIDGVPRIPNYKLINQEGDTVTQAITEGKIYVADFFFANCPDICIAMSSEMLRIQDKFKNNPDVKIISHTVDPKRDTPEAMKAYAERIGADTDMWTFLTGTKEDLYDLASCGYFISAQNVKEDPNAFIHKDTFVLVDKEKRIRGIYSGTDREDVDRLINEIQILMLEYK
ncbi:SCO family protein [Sediminitomix flava]|uniref:Protein SCO1/2 n=1 Tax=Sediminitomix flava TaxID=379075 RepID=A0A315ZYS9_SEDFL|nr:SCO family protein [Sediminitomix flava]PWJ42527.1 protein SCO1/2 [Sediminitomix flava]